MKVNSLLPTVLIASTIRLAVLKPSEPSRESPFFKNWKPGDCIVVRNACRTLGSSVIHLNMLTKSVCFSSAIRIIVI